VVSVLVCDEGARFRRELIVALEASPDIEVMAEADIGDTVVGQVQEAAPDVVWMGLRLSGPGGVRLTAAIRELVPSARVVVMAGPGDEDARRRALKAGATGLVSRDDALSLAVDVTKRVAWGRCVLGPDDLAALAATYAGFDRQAGSLQERVPPPTLDAVQRDVLARLAAGTEVGVVAAATGLTGASVENLVADAAARLHRFGRTEALVYAVGERLFDAG
jgi:DNA-binding NarL/FixJ family response regulator